MGFLARFPLSLKMPPVIMLLLIHLLLCRGYLRGEYIFKNFRYLKRTKFFHFLAGRRPQYLVNLDDPMQLLQDKVSCPITVKKSYYTLTLCKFCHRLVDSCTFYCNGVVVTCTQKINDICPSFHQYYPVRIKDSSAAGQLCLSKACKLARLACVIDVFEHLFSLSYRSCGPFLNYLPSAVNDDLFLYSSDVINSAQIEFSRKGSNLVVAINR